ncbi:MAG: putative topoisomerase [Cyanobacteria bacterium RYN_339]|nr:putative topoisomerase [Cyanobacteria bacterium RYN_339]
MESYDRWWQRDKARFLDAQGRPIADPAKLERVKKLRIPPAWTDVRISPSAKAKIQAVGRDAKGRRQYIYHGDWTRSQAAAKYAKLVAFAAALPRFRAVTSQALAGEGASRERVLALVSRLIMSGCFRIGGERYAKENKSFGIATLCNRHLTVGDTFLQFKFRGKRGIMQFRIVTDPELVAVMREVCALPGKRIFQYRRPDGSQAHVTGRDVNAYLKEVLGASFSAKDFRTWNGTLMAAKVLAAYGPKETASARKQVMVRTVRAVSRYLGNTPAIARASYISPRVFEAYEQGRTLVDFSPRGKRQARMIEAGHTAEELELIKLLAGSITISLIPDSALTSQARGATLAG